MQHSISGPGMRMWARSLKDLEKVYGNVGRIWRTRWKTPPRGKAAAPTCPVAEVSAHAAMAKLCMTETVKQ